MLSHDDTDRRRFLGLVLELPERFSLEVVNDNYFSPAVGNDDCCSTSHLGWAVESNPCCNAGAPHPPIWTLRPPPAQIHESNLPHDRLGVRSVRRCLGGGPGRRTGLHELAAVPRAEGRRFTLVQ